MRHHVCRECNGVSGQEGVCTTEGCLKVGFPLEVCDCTDEEHLDKLGDSTSKDTEEE